MSILNNDRPIGFFDSGVGGLTVLKHVKTLLPNENCIYYGDTLHVPYGDKTKEQLLEYSEPILHFFEEKKCKAVVMACNTTSSVIYDEIAEKYNFKLYPIVQSVAKVLANLDINKLGVFATKATINSHAYEHEIAKHNSNITVFGQYCPQWVNIVENNLFDDENSTNIIKADLEKMLKNNPDRIVLGCTHYPFLLEILSRYAPKNIFIDPADIFVQSIKDDLNSVGLLRKDAKNTYEDFYTSAAPEKFKQAAKMFYELKDEPNLLVF